MKMGKDWTEEQNKRMLRMERLYVLDGRHRPDHPKHGFYTGLHQQADKLEELDPACDVC